MKKEVDYTQPLTDVDKVRIYFRKQRGKIVKFIVQYLSLINGRWRTILRIDTCHGYPHKHTYHLRKGEFVVVLEQDIHTAFTEAKKHVLRDFRMIKENYLFSK